MDIGDRQPGQYSFIVRDLLAEGAPVPG
jgi:hypothetical protein